jgi:hypothetical protein
MQQPVMVDLAQARTAVFVLGPIAVIFDTEAAHHVGAFLDVRNRIDVQIVHHVAGIVVDHDMRMAYFADDLGTRFARARRAAVLLDHQDHPVILSDRAEPLEPFDPHRSVAALGVSERQHLRDTGRRGLLDPLGQHFQAARALGVDDREHHQRFEPQIAAAARQFGSSLRRRVLRHHRHLLAVRFPMPGAPGDIAVASRPDAAERALQGELAVGQGHARDLKLGRRPARLGFLAAAGPRLRGGHRRRRSSGTNRQKCTTRTTAFAGRWIDRHGHFSWQRSKKPTRSTSFSSFSS